VQMNIWVSEIIYNLCFSKIIYRNNSTEWTNIWFLDWFKILIYFAEFTNFHTK
jgi:hypothetical protein